MMGELLEMDVVNVPTYDGFQAAATALRMAARITGRRRGARAGLDRPRQALEDPRLPAARTCELELVPFDPATGLLDLGALGRALGPDVAGVFVENPAYLGIVETRPRRSPRLAHAAGALAVGSVDPSRSACSRRRRPTAPTSPAATSSRSGIHMQFGGGHGGFIASDDDPRFVMEFPSRLFGIAPTIVRGRVRLRRRRLRAHLVRRPRGGQGVGRHGRGAVGHHGRRLPRAHGAAGDGRARRGR